jgi:hypothetical protein
MSILVASDPDPTQKSGSDWILIRIRNTALKVFGAQIFTVRGFVNFEISV